MIVPQPILQLNFQGNTLDSSVYHNVITSETGISYNEKGAMFDGTTSNIYYNTTLGIIDTSDFTISTEVYLTKAPTSGEEYPFCVFVFPNNKYYTYFSYNNVSGNLCIDFDFGYITNRFYNVDLGIFTKHHIVYIKRGTQIEGYLNGKNVYNQTRALNGAGTQGLWIGSNNAVNRFLPGCMSNILIYDRALSPSEVFYLYQKKQPSLLRRIGNTISAAINTNRFFQGW